MKIIRTFLLLGLILMGPFSLHANIFSSDLSPEEIQAKIVLLPAEGKDRTKSGLYANLGDALYGEGKIVEAAEAFEKSLQFRPSGITKKHVYLYLGKCYESTDRLDKAIEAYESAVEYDKRNWKRHRDLAINYERAQLYADAINSYRKAIKYNSDHASTYYALGRSLRKSGFYRDAEENLVQALELGYKNDPVFKELSIVFEGQGKYVDAASALNEVIKAESSNSDWGRLIYLSALSKDRELVERGLVGLYAKTPNEETIIFYEDLAKNIAKENKNIFETKFNSPYLESLLEDVVN